MATEETVEKTDPDRQKPLLKLTWIHGHEVGIFLMVRWSTYFYICT